MKFRSKTRSALEAMIPGGPVTPEMRRQMGVTSEITTRDVAGFPSVVRQRVANRFLSMLDDGTLTKAEATAAILLKCYADQIHATKVSTYRDRVDESRNSHDSALIARIDNIDKVNGALRFLSPELRRVTCAYILEVPEDAVGMGSSFTRIGADYLPSERRDDCRRIAGKALVVAACRDLAVYFRHANGFEFDIAEGITGLKSRRIRST